MFEFQPLFIPEPGNERTNEWELGLLCAAPREFELTVIEEQKACSLPAGATHLMLDCLGERDSVVHFVGSTLM
jgi:hypothetical protein